MSTKTTFKRIALVTVAALGLSVVAVAPSSATVSAISLTASATTATQRTGETSTATAATVTLGFLNSNLGDTASVTAYLISAPAGNTKLPVLQVVETASAVADETLPATTPIAVGGVITSQLVYVSGTTGPAAVSAKFQVYMDAPSVLGAYVVKLVPTNVAGGGLAADTTGVTVTITVSANPLTDSVATSATSIIFATVADSTTAVDKTVTAIKTANATGTPNAIIKVSTLNSAGVSASESYTAIVKSGPGLLGKVTAATSAKNGDALGRAIAVGSELWVGVYADGASGVSVIEIQSKAGVVLATETLTFYGDATKMTSAVSEAVIGLGVTTEVLVVNLYDAAGTEVTGSQDFYVTSSATSVISGTYTKITAQPYNTTDKGYWINLTGVAAGTANITVGTKASATATTGLEAAPVSVRVGGGASKLADVKVAFDKTSYLPGELAVITVTPVDAAGLTLAPDTYTVFAAGGIVSPVAFTGGTNDAITAVSAHNRGVAGTGTVAGVATYKVYMPAYQGTFVFKYTTGAFTAGLANSGVARTVSVDVGTSDGGAAAAAAEEATAAANDATDAALSAAEAAEAATAIAQEAVDAVAALSTQVAQLISALRAQIKTLTNLVVKIQKKVKA